MTQWKFYISIDFQDPPWQYRVPNKNSNDISLDGYAADIWKSLHSFLNFSYSVTTSEDGTFNGLIDMVVHNKADFVLTALKLTKSRAKRTQYTTDFQTNRFIKCDAMTKNKQYQ